VDLLSGEAEVEDRRRAVAKGDLSRNQ
jgi:hypothetical protein